MLVLLLLAGQGVLLSQTAKPAVSTAPTASQISQEESSAQPAHTISEDQVSDSLPTATGIDAQAAVGAIPGALQSASKVSPAKSLASTGGTSPQPAKFDVTQIGHRNVGNGLNFYSIEREIAVGRDLAKQVEETSKLVTDPEITDYVNRLGQALVRNSDSRVPFSIKVIDSGEVNAFALPGGFFYVDSGLLLAADSEAELAAIMAHEIAHVAARHATKNMTKQQIWNMASIPLMFVGGPAGYAIAEVASIAIPMSFLKFSRDSEREADMLGLQYDYAAGYDPQAFIQFFERLKAAQKQKHSKIAKLFSTHPMTADRITAAQNEIQNYFPERDSYIVDTSEFEMMKARLIALQTGRAINPDKEPNRPVLRDHTDTRSAIAAATGTQAAPAQQSGQSDDGPPVLRRADPTPN